jgi:hypothetical protein
MTAQPYAVVIQPAGPKVRHPASTISSSIGWNLDATCWLGRSANVFRRAIFSSDIWMPPQLWSERLRVDHRGDGGPLTICECLLRAGEPHEEESYRSLSLRYVRFPSPYGTLGQDLLQRPSFSERCRGSPPGVVHLRARAHRDVRQSHGCRKCSLGSDGRSQGTPACGYLGAIKVRKQFAEEYPIYS